MRLKRCRTGLTLVETIVVIGIVALLLAVLLPALQNSRESARSSQCRNRMRQLGISLLSYEAARGNYPRGVMGNPDAVRFNESYNNVSSPHHWKRFPYTSWLAVLLPFLEHEGLASHYEGLRAYDQKSMSAGAFWFGEFEGYSDLAPLQLACFRCPSDSLLDYGLHVFGAPQSVVVGNPPRDAMSYEYLNDYHDLTLGITNYVGCTGTHSGGRQPNRLLDPWNGVLSSGDAVRNRDVRDGFSKTSVVGEYLGLVDDGSRTVGQSWLAGGIARGRGNFKLRQRENGENRDLLTGPRNSGLFDFGSAHPNGVNFLYLDGHVKTVTRNVNWLEIRGMYGISDGQDSESQVTVQEHHGTVGIDAG